MKVVVDADLLAIEDVATTQVVVAAGLVVVEAIAQVILTVNLVGVEAAAPRPAIETTIKRDGYIVCKK